MPTCWRKETTSWDLSKILLSSSIASPSVRVPGIRSFIRLSVRKNVDLPQPDGPMSAVTCFSRMGIETSKSACFDPYQKLVRRTSIFTPASVLTFAAVSATTTLGTPEPLDGLGTGALLGSTADTSWPDLLIRVSMKPSDVSNTPTIFGTSYYMLYYAGGYPLCTGIAASTMRRSARTTSRM